MGNQKTRLDKADDAIADVWRVGIDRFVNWFGDNGTPAQLEALVRVVAADI